MSLVQQNRREADRPIAKHIFNGEGLDATKGLRQVCKNRDDTADQVPSRSMPIHEARRSVVKSLVGAA
jgi:hypothetical protein